MHTMSTSRILDYSIFIYYLITFTKTKRKDRQKEAAPTQETYSFPLGALLCPYLPRATRTRHKTLDKTSLSSVGAFNVFV